MPSSTFSSRFPLCSLPDEVQPGVVTSVRRARGREDVLMVDACFPAPLSKDLLYRAEEEILRAYGEAVEVREVRILPHYPPETFSADYVPQLMAECRRVGALGHGFFEEGRYSFDLTPDRTRLTLKIPFEGGAALLHDAAGTARTIEGILASEFYAGRGEDCPIRVSIVEGEGAERYREELDRRVAQDIAAAVNEPFIPPADLLSREGEDAEDGEDPGQAAPPATRVTSLYGEDPPEDGEEVAPGVYRLGKAVFDLREPTLFFLPQEEGGDPGAPLGRPTPLSRLSAPARHITAVGHVDQVDIRESFDGATTFFSIGVTDYRSSVMVSLVLRGEEAEDLRAALTAAGRTLSRGGKPVITVYDLDLAVEGDLRYEKRRKDGSPRELQLNPSRIFRVRRVLREDNAPVKRVELHLHTNFSTMDALPFPEFVLETAQRWGWDAVGFTDHGNVQSYPILKDLAADLDKKHKADPEHTPPGVKVLYGMEAYFVDDTARAVFGDKRADLTQDELVVFDIETTGISVLTCHLTEIGALKVRGGEIVGQWHSLVNPGEHIPEEVTGVTGITDEMVRGAPTEEEAVRAFLAFAGEDVLIAHNGASFDIPFLRKICRAHRIPFENTYLDTLPLARYLNPELYNHRLNTLAEAYSLGEFDHHRALADTEMLAKIFFCLAARLREEGVRNLAQVNDTLAEGADPKNGRVYHMVIYAKNETGRKNLYKLISASYLEYYRRFPRIPLSLLLEYREGLLLGSACEAGELFEAILTGRSEEDQRKIAEKYDYLEIMPLSNNRFLVGGQSGRRGVPDEEALRDINRRIVALGEEMGKPVCATCDAHFLNPEEEIFRKILLKGQKYADGDRDSELYLRTTNEMLDEFAYLGEEKAYEVVVTNTRKVASEIERVSPVPDGIFTPKLEGAEEQLAQICRARADELYGHEGVLPQVVSERMEKELGSIIQNGFAVLYIIARKLVTYSESEGYAVGSRGSVGSSVVAMLAGISEVNPLPPHYLCPNCRYSDFSHPEVRSGFDLPPRACPVCGEPLRCDGQNIPFETFLGFHGEKSPDIDLNFSPDVQGKVHRYTEELFGKGHVFRAGTLNTLASRNAYGYVMKYLEEKGISLPRAEVNRLVNGCLGVKKTSGQHPGGIVVLPKEYEIEDFTPVQHPADNPAKDVITTHFPFAYLHDTLLKLDELGHDIPTKYKWLETYSGRKIEDVPMNDEAVYRLFRSVEPLGLREGDIDCKVGTWALPEAGTPFVQRMLEDSRPQSFADLLQVSGLSHGTGVWAGNADELIRSGKCSISEVIGCRDDIMLTLIRYGLPSSLAFEIMEKVRKGKGLKKEWEEEMSAHGVPDWYIASCKKIQYLFPKAHAAAYQMSAVRMAWYKIHEPLAFYAAYFTAQPLGVNALVVQKGREVVREMITELDASVKERKAGSGGEKLSMKEARELEALQIIDESMARGIAYLPIDLYRSDPAHFLPEEGGIRLPFCTLPGMGDVAAQNIADVRGEGEFTSREDLRERAKIPSNVMDLLELNGTLDGLQTRNQIALFGDAPLPKKKKSKKKKKTANEEIEEDEEGRMSLF